MKRRKTKITNIQEVQTEEYIDPDEYTFEEHLFFAEDEGGHLGKRTLNDVSYPISNNGVFVYFWITQVIPCDMTYARNILSIIYSLTTEILAVIERINEIYIPMSTFLKYTDCDEKTIAENIKWLEDKQFIYVYTKDNKTFYGINMDKVQPLIEQYEYSVMNATTIICRMSKIQLQTFMCTLNDFLPLVEVDDSFSKLVTVFDDDVSELWRVFEKLSLSDKAKVMLLLDDEIKNKEA
ncbi:MAG: hypothetical protein NC244_07030 [Alistipes senegalensis]|nr:hypothetical protein [Alistipes senegalensis]